MVIAAALLLTIAQPAHSESLNTTIYTIVRDGPLQQLNFSTILSDGTFLLAGSANDKGFYMIADDKGKIIQQFSIKPKEFGYTALRGASRFGDHIIAVAFDYENNKSVIVLIRPNGKYVVTERFGGEIESVKAVDDGLLVSGSYYNKNKQQVPWAAKVDTNGKFVWIYEDTPNQITEPGTQKHFEFCAEMHGESYLLRHEALGYPDGRIYTLIKIAKDGLWLSEARLDLPKMEYGSLFTNFVVHDEALILYGRIKDSDHDDIASSIAIDRDGKIMWFSQYDGFTGVGAFIGFQDVCCLSLVAHDQSDNVIMLTDNQGNTISKYSDPLLNAEDHIIRNMLADNDGNLWLIGTKNNIAQCFIAKMNGI